jgi:hypothetical protein
MGSCNSEKKPHNSLQNKANLVKEKQTTKDSLYEEKIVVKRKDTVFKINEGNVIDFFTGIKKPLQKPKFG